MRRAIHLFGRALRETGQKLDRFALESVGNEIYQETYSRHRSVMNLFDRVRCSFSCSCDFFLIICCFQYPTIAAGGFIAPSASVIGKVLLYDSVSVGQVYSLVLLVGSNSEFSFVDLVWCCSERRQEHHQTWPILQCSRQSSDQHSNGS